MARATGKLQKSGVSSRSPSVIPGPNDGTMSSTPYGPPLTLKKKMAASGTSPSSRLRPLFRSRPLSCGDELRELLHPFLDRAPRLHDDLELAARQPADAAGRRGAEGDRKSTRLNSSHLVISYAVFCLKKKKKQKTRIHVNYRLTCTGRRRYV